MEEKSVLLKLNEVIFGVRYEKRWHTLDIIGEIADDVIRSKKSPFDEKYFPLLGDQPYGRELINHKTGCLLRVNIDDIIFKHVLDENNDILKGKDINWFFSSVKDYIVPELIIKFGFERIARIGIVYSHFIPKEEISFEMLNQITADLGGESTKFSIDFHKKFPVTEALAKKGVNDYQNVIHFIKTKGDDKYEIGIDYQYYFAPPIDHIKDFNFNHLFEHSNTYLKDTFYPWIKKLFNKIRVEGE